MAKAKDIVNAPGKAKAPAKKRAAAKKNREKGREEEDLGHRRVACKGEGPSRNISAGRYKVPGIDGASHRPAQIPHRRRCGAQFRAGVPHDQGQGFGAQGTCQGSLQGPRLSCWRRTLTAKGEAIAFQIGKYLAEKDAALPIRRITFNEITQKRHQGSRRRSARARPLPRRFAEGPPAVLDRLVGYNLSPLLWKKVKNGPFGRPRPVGDPQAHLRQGKGSVVLHPRGILVHRSRVQSPPRLA